MMRCPYCGEQYRGHNTTECKICGTKLIPQDDRPERNHRSFFVIPVVLAVLAAAVTGALFIYNRSIQKETKQESMPDQQAAASEADSAEPDTAETDTASAQTETDPLLSEDAPIRIVSYELGQIDDGAESMPYIQIEYEFLNIWDSEGSFNFLFTDLVFQNGIECRKLLNEQITDASGLSAGFPSGVTKKVKVGYCLHDMTAVTVSVTRWGEGTVYLDEKIDLGEGDGAEIDTAHLSPTSVRYEGHRVDVDALGQKILIIDFSFYNGEEKPKGFLWTYTADVFQNGEKCQGCVGWSYLYDSWSDNLHIMPGVTIKVSQAFELEDDSEVQLVVRRYGAEETILEETLSLS